MAIFPKLVEIIRAKQLNHILLIGGGVIPKPDQRELESNGVDQIFGPGTSTRDIIDYIRKAVGTKASAAQ